MHYCTRSPERTAFRRRASTRLGFASRVQFHLDDGPEAQKLDIAAVLATPRPARTSTCAARKASWTAVLGTRASAGWPERRNCTTSSSRPTSMTRRTTMRASRCSSPARATSSIVPKDKTVVQALAEAGVEVLTSCEQGVCGTCLTRVLEGEPRSQGHVPHARGAGGQRPVHAMLLALELAEAGTGPVAAPLARRGRNQRAVTTT